MAQQWGQVIAMVQQNLSNAWGLMAQEVRYVQQQWEHLLGIASNAPMQSLGTSVSQTGSGMGNSPISTKTAPDAASISPNTHKVQELTSNGPNIIGEGPYVWDPLNPANDINASNPVNWLLNGVRQNANGVKPGNAAGDTAIFDPGNGFIKDGNGNAAINWDYQATFSTMQMGGVFPYTGQQTIKSGIVVELTGVNASNASVTLQNTGSDLRLSFTDGTSKFQIDKAATISNMHLGGDKTGQFLINGGTTTIAQSSTYTELEGVAFTVGKGAILSDKGQCPLKFWNSSIILKVQGEMDVNSGPNATNTLIDINGNSKDYIDVIGAPGAAGLLNYIGISGNKDTFTVPVLVENGGTFQVTSGANGWLIVTGNLNGVAPGVSNNASVYMKDTNSDVALSNTSTLECDGDYYQSGGRLESTDASVCTLQNGQTSNGTATIAGGSLNIDFPGIYQPGSFGFFNINCSQLDFNGTYAAHIAGNMDGVNTNDVLTINKSQGTLNLQGGSALTVAVDNQPPVGQKFSWSIIKAGNFLNPQFNTEQSVPNTPGLKYGPAGAAEYDVTF